MSIIHTCINFWVEISPQYVGGSKFIRKVLGRNRVCKIDPWRWHSRRAEGWGVGDGQDAPYRRTARSRWPPCGHDWTQASQPKGTTTSCQARWRAYWPRTLGGLADRVHPVLVRHFRFFCVLPPLTKTAAEKLKSFFVILILIFINMSLCLDMIADLHYCHFDFPIVVQFACMHYYIGGAI
jgi:hypothetical protein